MRATGPATTAFLAHAGQLFVKDDVTIPCTCTPLHVFSSAGSQAMSLTGRILTYAVPGWTRPDPETVVQLNAAAMVFKDGRYDSVDLYLGCRHISGLGNIVVDDFVPLSPPLRGWCPQPRSWKRVSRASE